MAQRNPLNQRYQGEGPAGQTRKSASSIKPASNAASSVQIKGKPETSAEKKAAEKERQAKIQQKAEERQRKAARNEQNQRTAEVKAKLSRGEITESEAEEQIQDIIEVDETPKKKKTGMFSEQAAMEREMTKDPVYRKWQRLYWACFAGGLVLVVISVFLQFSGPSDSNAWLYVVIPAYILVFVGFGIQWLKIRPYNAAYRRNASTKKSPKQVKHDEAEIQAKQLEVARKEAKSGLLKKRNQTAVKTQSLEDEKEQS